MGEKKLLWITLGLALVLRLVNLGQSFWLDEASQAQMSSLSVREIWFGRSGDFHPPAFYLIAHYWLWFGKSEVWLRLPSVIFGVVTVWVIYYLAGYLFPGKKTRIGLIASFLLAINPFHIYYSQEFRSYSLLVLLGLLSMYALVKKHWSLFIINALLLYTHYSSSFLIASQLVYALLFDRKLLKFVISHLSLVIILYLPWLPQFVRQLQVGVNIESYLPGWRGMLTVSTLKSVPLVLFKLAAGRINLLPKMVYGVYIVFVLGVVAGSGFLLRQKRPFLAIWILGPLLMSMVVSLRVPQTQPFRLIYILPGLILVFSYACMRYPKMFLTFMVYVAITGNFLYFTRSRLQREQWRQAVDFVSRQPGPAVVKFTGRFSPFAWYSPSLQVIAAVPSLPTQPREVAAALQTLPGYSTVFVFDYLGEVTDPQDLVATTVRNLGFVEDKTYNFEGVGFIHEYRKI